MQELEKILEEMKESSITVATSKEHYIHPQDGRFVEEVVLLDDIEKIIHKHMNDGWIPVEERLPENNKLVLVWARSTARGADEWWRPLPEPYHPERSDNHDGE